MNEMLITPKSCVLAAGAYPRGCDWCGKSPTNAMFCTPWCNYQWRINHIWKSARKAALQRDNYTCTKCNEKDDLEVNHVRPLRGQGYGLSCRHHQDNLATLCHDCHAEETKAQNAIWA